MTDTPRLAARFAVVSALLFALLVALQLATGASQHFFELVHPPDVFARALLEHADWLKVVFALDDLFIACYLSAGLFAVLALPRQALTWPVFALVCAAGLLDLEENHHLLALLDAAQAGLPLAPAELIRRMDLSSVKWALAHLGFFGLAFLVPGQGALPRAFRGLSVGLQLPVGLAGVVYGEVRWLALLRAFNLFVGFLVLARLVSSPAAGHAAGSGAPASPRGTTPAIAG
jgi:hypothetical protein